MFLALNQTSKEYKFSSWFVDKTNSCILWVCVCVCVSIYLRDRNWWPINQSQEVFLSFFKKSKFKHRNALLDTHTHTNIGTLKRTGWWTQQRHTRFQMTLHPHILPFIVNSLRSTPFAHSIFSRFRKWASLTCFGLFVKVSTYTRNFITIKLIQTHFLLSAGCYKNDFLPYHTHGWWNRSLEMCVCVCVWNANEIFLFSVFVR